MDCDSHGSEAGHNSDTDKEVRRKSRNDTERRRKEKIKQSISILSDLIPKDRANNVKKNNTNGILENAIDYIKYLTDQNQKIIAMGAGPVVAQEMTALRLKYSLLLDEKSKLEESYGSSIHHSVASGDTFPSTQSKSQDSNPHGSSAETSGAATLVNGTAPIMAANLQPSESQLAASAAPADNNPYKSLGTGLIITKSGQAIFINEDGCPVAQGSFGGNPQLSSFIPASTCGTTVVSVASTASTLLSTSAASKVDVSTVSTSNPIAVLPKPAVPSGPGLPFVAPTALPPGALSAAGLSPAMGGANRQLVSLPGQGGLPTALILPNGQVIPVVAPGMVPDGAKDLPSGPSSVMAAIGPTAANGAVAPAIIPSSTAGGNLMYVTVPQGPMALQPQSQVSAGATQLLMNQNQLQTSMPPNSLSGAQRILRPKPANFTDHMDKLSKRTGGDNSKKISAAAVAIAANFPPSKSKGKDKNRSSKLSTSSSGNKDDLGLQIDLSKAGHKGGSGALMTFPGMEQVPITPFDQDTPPPPPPPPQSCSPNVLPPASTASQYNPKQLPSTEKDPAENPSSNEFAKGKKASKKKSKKRNSTSSDGPVPAKKTKKTKSPAAKKADSANTISIPDTITFDTTDLDSVLDQVENLDNDAAIENPVGAEGKKPGKKKPKKGKKSAIVVEDPSPATEEEIIGPVYSSEVLLQSPTLHIEEASEAKTTEDAIEASEPKELVGEPDDSPGSLLMDVSGTQTSDTQPGLPSVESLSEERIDDFDKPASDASPGSPLSISPPIKPPTTSPLPMFSTPVSKCRDPSNVSKSSDFDYAPSAEQTPRPYRAWPNENSQLNTPVVSKQSNKTSESTSSAEKWNATPDKAQSTKYSDASVSNVVKETLPPSVSISKKPTNESHWSPLTLHTTSQTTSNPSPRNNYNNAIQSQPGFSPPYHRPSYSTDMDKAKYTNNRKPSQSGSINVESPASSVTSEPTYSPYHNTDDQHTLYSRHSKVSLPPSQSDKGPLNMSNIPDAMSAAGNQSAEAQRRYSFSDQGSVHDSMSPNPIGTYTVDLRREQNLRSEPMRNEPLRSEPLRREPLRNEQLRSEPMRSAPMRSEPMRSEPMRSEPIRMSNDSDCRPNPRMDDSAMALTNHKLGHQSQLQQRVSDHHSQTYQQAPLAHQPMQPQSHTQMQSQSHHQQQSRQQVSHQPSSEQIQFQQHQQPMTKHTISHQQQSQPPTIHQPQAHHMQPPPGLPLKPQQLNRPPSHQNTTSEMKSSKEPPPSGFSTEALLKGPRRRNSSSSQGADKVSSRTAFTDPGVSSHGFAGARPADHNAVPMNVNMFAGHGVLNASNGSRSARSSCASNLPTQSSRPSGSIAGSVMSYASNPVGSSVPTPSVSVPSQSLHHFPFFPFPHMAPSQVSDSPPSSFAFPQRNHPAYGHRAKSPKSLGSGAGCGLVDAQHSSVSRSGPSVVTAPRLLHSVTNMYSPEEPPLSSGSRHTASSGGSACDTSQGMRSLSNFGIQELTGKSSTHSKQLNSQKKKIPNGETPGPFFPGHPGHGYLTSLSSEGPGAPNVPPYMHSSMFHTHPSAAAAVVSSMETAQNRKGMPDYFNHTGSIFHNPSSTPSVSASGGKPDIFNPLYATRSALGPTPTPGVPFNIRPNFPASHHPIGSQIMAHSNSPLTAGPFLGRSLFESQGQSDPMLRYSHSHSATSEPSHLYHPRQPIIPPNPLGFLGHSGHSFEPRTVGGLNPLSHPGQPSSFSSMNFMNDT